jgi:hypothetical protein
MNSPAEVIPTNQTSVKRMAIILALAFLGSQLNLAGALVLLLEYMLSGFSPNLIGATVLILLAFFLLFASFLALSLYPQHGPRQILAGFLALIPWIVGMTASYNTQLFHLLGLDPYDNILHSYVREISIATAIAVCLYVSGRIKGWLGLTGLSLGLLIGIWLRTSNLYTPINIDYAPLWLSTAFFSELFSRRAGWRAALAGILLLGGLIGLAALVARFVWLISGGG